MPLRVTVSIFFKMGLLVSQALQDQQVKSTPGTTEKKKSEHATGELSWSLWGKSCTADGLWLDLCLDLMVSFYRYLFERWLQPACLFGPECWRSTEQSGYRQLLVPFLRSLQHGQARSGHQIRVEICQSVQYPSLKTFSGQTGNWEGFRWEPQAGDAEISPQEKKILNRQACRGRSNREPICSGENCHTCRSGRTEEVLRRRRHAHISEENSSDNATEVHCWPSGPAYHLPESEYQVSESQEEQCFSNPGETNLFPESLRGWRDQSETGHQDVIESKRRKTVTNPGCVAGGYSHTHIWWQRSGFFLNLLL